MKKISVDVAVIGAGSAGLNARRAVEKAGGRPLLIESGPYGTTCARVGCMPSKLLIAAADAAHGVATAGSFGVDVGSDWHVDGPRVFERVRTWRDKFTERVVEDTESLPDEQRLRGHARFVAPTSLAVEGSTRVDARAVVIATGSSPVIPPPYDAIAEHVLISDDIFELEDLPGSMAVIGTGIIGLELGQALQRLGTRVTFFNPFEQLGPFTDPAIAAATRNIFEASLDLELGSEMLAARPHGGGVRLHYRDRDGREHEALFDKVLVAAGRKPNLAELDLERAGIELNEHGHADWNPRTTQIGELPVFLAGDASGHLPLLHEASDEGRIAGANAMRFPDVSARERRTALAIAFTDPQMAMIGKRFDQLDPDQVEIGEVSFRHQGRAQVMGSDEGLLRVYGDRECCTVVGAEMIGPRVEHLAHLLAWVAQDRMPVAHTLRMPFYHPVIEEGLRTALRDLARKLDVTGQCRGEDFATAPGH